MTCTSVYNLVRNSRVFFSTNLTSATIPNAVALTGHTVATTSEIQVLEGFTFSQQTTNTTIGVSEAGESPTRGQRAFNTALNPAEFNFTTYLRPFSNAGSIEPEERFLWNALLSSKQISTTNFVNVSTVTAAARSATTNSGSNILTLTATASGVTTGTTPSPTVLVVGEIVLVQELEGAFAKEWNIPAKVVSANATTVVLELMSAPSAGAGTTAAVPAGGVVKLLRSAWASSDAVSPEAAYGQISTAYSNANQLAPFGLIFIVDGVTYTMDNCAMNTATIDFTLDGIAQVAWTGFGTQLNQLATTVTLSNATDPVASGGITGTFKGKNTLAQFITNKLSTMELISNIAGVSGTTYQVAITGGSIAFNNNIAYITPASLGVVNKAIGYYTGARSISGNVTAYLKTGAGNTTAKLQQDILNSGNPLVEPKFDMNISIGGGKNAVKVEIDMPGTTLTVPTVETGDLVTTTINFTAQGYCPEISANMFDLSQTNDATVRYYSV